MADLDGKVALVTGASRGLGEGAARALDGGLVGDVAGRCLGATASRRDLARYLGRHRVVARDQHHGRAAARECTGDPLAETAARAGHQRHLAVEIGHCPILPRHVLSREF